MDDHTGSSKTNVARFPTLRWGLLSAIALWIAQPPLSWWPLAWIAPIGWLMVVARKESLDRGDWLRLYVSGIVYWLLAVHWIRLPHPLTILGWPLLCLYLGCYPLAFVWLTRRGISYSRLPLWAVAPVVWAGLEYLQAHLFTGFLMGAVSHSQASQLWLIPIASSVGAYGVSFLILFFASLLYEVFVRDGRCCEPSTSSAIAAALLGISFFVVSLHVVEQQDYTDPQSITVALIQGNTLANWDPDPNRSKTIMDAQTLLSIKAVEQAAAEGKQLDLIVWPESMFRVSIDTFDGSFEPPTGANEQLIKSQEHCRAWFQSLTNKLETPLLVGIDHYDWIADPDDPEALPTAESYNSALLVDAQGEFVALYNKTHRVPFGEYIPLAQGMPAMYYLTPMSGGLRPGKGPVAMNLTTRLGEQVQMATNICFESTVPHVIRGHVKELSDQSQLPDLLVNVTNDAWFWGSSELDTHLACNIYRAVETGTPMIVAANGGLSAVISSRGEVTQISPRMEEYVLIAEVPLRGNQEPTLYVQNGDWFAMSCFGCCAGFGLFGFFKRFTGTRRLQENSETQKVEDR